MKKIRTQEDVDLLELKIKNELGVDVAQYRNPEVAENFAELLLFPKYVITYTIGPVLVSLALYIIGFFVVDLVHIQYMLYAIIALILFLVCGILFGLLYLTWKMKTDMQSVIEYSLNIVEATIDDYDQVKANINDENRKEVLSLLFSGVTHIVTIPMVSEIIVTNIPIFKGFFKRMFTKVMRLMPQKEIKLDTVQMRAEKRATAGASPLIDRNQKSAHLYLDGMNKFLGVTFSVYQFPLKVLFGISFFLLILFLYLIW